MKKILEFLFHTGKTILKLLFNRIFYIALAILIQLGWILITVWRLNEYSQPIAIITRILALIIVLKIQNNDINPSYKLAWTLLIMLTPVLGLEIYLLFGRTRINRISKERGKAIEESLRPYLREKEETRRVLEEKDTSIARQSHYIYHYAGYPVQKNTSADYFTVGDDMFPVMIRELRSAKKFIFIEYFIINDGIMWQSILDILEEKAKEGVDVRLIYDGFGCLTTLPRKYQQYLQGRGIRCLEFNPFRPFLNIIQNNRDHRKICVIDGKTGFTGGVNLADEYINQKDRFGHWKDTAVMLKGDAVWNFTAMFLSMWGMLTGELPEKPENYFPEISEGNKAAEEGTSENSEEKRNLENGFVQPYCDTPLDNEIVGEHVYLNIINRAKKYVYICTPYLIIDNEMTTALCLAAKSGIDVRIMTPGVPDKKLVFMLTRSYYRRLLESGVRIFEYKPGFLHAKSFVCDDEVSVVGTINMDYRSLYLHFEDGVWMYANKAILDIRTDFLDTLCYCDEITLEQVKNRHWTVRVAQSILRLFAPLL